MHMDKPMRVRCPLAMASEVSARRARRESI